MHQTVFHRNQLLRRDHQRDARRIQHRIRAARAPQNNSAAASAAPGWTRFSPGDLPAVSPGPGGLPEVHTRELSPATLVTALAHSGALLVRDLIPGYALGGLATATREVVRACAEAAARGEANQAHGLWHHPPRELLHWMPNGELGRSRGFHRASGSAMCVESPSVAESLLEFFEAMNLKALASAALGDQPCLSVKKWVLRDTRLPVDPRGWHQDGAFMGRDIRSLNLWIPLTHCGGASGAPGMDILPRRLWQVLSPKGATFDWSVDPARVAEAFPETPPVSPVFRPGDALFFDHFLLHRTQYRDDLTRSRLAIETWFFARSQAPENQVPLAW